MAKIKKTTNLHELAENARKVIYNRLSQRGLYPELSKRSKIDGLNKGKGFHTMTLIKMINGSYSSPMPASVLLWVKETIDVIDQEEIDNMADIYSQLAA